MSSYHLDTDFLIYAVEVAGPERDQVFGLLDAGSDLRLSAVAWYEFCRGPRTPHQLALARTFFGSQGVLPFSEELALRAADTFRSLGSPRRRAADIAIGTTAAWCHAPLLTRNVRDFEGIPDLSFG